MESCVKYHVTSAEVFAAFIHSGVSLDAKDVKDTTTILGSDLWEVWEGLPVEYRFELVESRGGEPGLCVRQRGLRIWVMPKARRALETNPRQILFALGQRRDNSLNFDYVALPFKSFTLMQAIAHVKNLNRNLILEYFRKIGKERQQKAQKTAKPQK